MTDLRTALRATDPLTLDAAPGDAEVARRRAVVLADGRRLASSHAPRRAPALAFAAVVAVMLAALVTWEAWHTRISAAVRFEVRLAEDRDGAGLRAMAVGTDPRVVYVGDDALLTNDDIEGARVVPGPTPATWSVEIGVSRAAGERLRVATSQHVGRPLAFIVDGLVTAAPVVRSAIGEVGVLSGAYTREEAERLARGVLAR